jgi:hypothetical protein
VNNAETIIRISALISSTQFSRSWYSIQKKFFLQGDKVLGTSFLGIIMHAIVLLVANKVLEALSLNST